MISDANVGKRLIGTLRGSLPWQLAAVGAGMALRSLRERNFLVLSSARSGSNLMVDYLRCHWRVRCFREILNDKYVIYGSLRDKPSWRKRLQVLSYFAKAPMRPFQLPRQFVGAKVLIDQFELSGLPLSTIIEDLGFPKILCVYRKDMLETFVSLKIAKLNNRWYSRTSPNSESIVVDPDEFRSYCNSERKLWDESLSQIRGRCEIHFSEYESLVARPGVEMRQALAFIGLQFTREPVARSIRQNPQPLSRKIVNYEAIRNDDELWTSLRFLQLQEGPSVLQEARQ